MSGRVGVVGGGLGGLSAAAVLAAQGHQVTVFERNEWLGGKAAELRRDGFRFDMGPTIMMLPSAWRRVFAAAGRTLEDEVELVRLDPQWRCFYPDGGTLDLWAGADQMKSELESFAPGSAAGYESFLEHSRDLHALAQDYFFDAPIGSLWDVIKRKGVSPSTLLDVLKMRPGATVAGTVRGHVPEPRVAQMLDHFTQYVGSAPDASPAVLCGIAHMQTEEGVWYPVGGIRALVEALIQLLSDFGVELRTGEGVEQILVQEGRTAGVRLEGGEQVALDGVVCNADVVRAHEGILEGVETGALTRDYEAACSGVVLYLGLRERYDHLLHHNFVFSKDPEAEFEAIYHRGEPAEDLTAYVCAPAQSDPGVAPEGGEALYVLVHAPSLRPGQDWDEIYPAYRERILDKLVEQAGLSDLRERIVCEDALTPASIHSRYKVLNGAIYGLASHGRFMGAFKPSNVSSGVQGLTFAGGSAHPGPGMPMVVMSGWIAGNALAADLLARTPLLAAAD
jgi:diapolycopene oxygenase